MELCPLPMFDQCSILHWECWFETLDDSSLFLWMIHHHMSIFFSGWKSCSYSNHIPLYIFIKRWWLPLRSLLSSHENRETITPNVWLSNILHTKKKNAAHEPECSHVEHFCETRCLNSLVRFSPVTVPVHCRLWNPEGVKCKVRSVECSVNCRVWSVVCEV